MPLMAQGRAIAGLLDECGLRIWSLPQQVNRYALEKSGHLAIAYWRAAVAETPCPAALHLEYMRARSPLFGSSDFKSE
jgi:hypothetical protein